MLLAVLPVSWQVHGRVGLEATSPDVQPGEDFPQTRNMSIFDDRRKGPVEAS